MSPVPVPAGMSFPAAASMIAGLARKPRVIHGCARHGWHGAGVPRPARSPLMIPVARDGAGMGRPGRGDGRGGEVRLEGPQAVATARARRTATALTRTI
jgi:hypothetical protein